MKKFICGFIVGVIAVFVFIYFGGGEWMKNIGKKTEDIKNIQENIGNKIEKKIEDIKR